MTEAPSRTRIAANLVALNAGWFACILGAAHGTPWLGPWVVAGLLGLHLVLTPARTRGVEGVLPVLAGLVGYGGDSVLVLAGALDFPPSSGLVPPTRVWMVALWMNFATALGTTLYWLAGRYWLGGLLGALGGPLAYLGGAGLGAVTLAGGTGWALSLVALEWALAMPLLMQIRHRCRRSLLGPRFRPEPEGAE